MVEALRGDCQHSAAPEVTAVQVSGCHAMSILTRNLSTLSSGLTFDIYEGQITALLGHSGAGKSSLLNILCGICPPTNGMATIYGSPVTEIAEGSEMKQLVGICPQFNIIFDVLTVEEHLRMFAAIKGIPPAETDAQVKPWCGKMVQESRFWSGSNELSLLIRLFSIGGEGVEGSGLGEDHDGPSQEPERRPKEETLCRHRHLGRSKGTWSLVLHSSVFL